MGNAYLDRLTSDYEGIRASMQGAQDRAAAEDRDLTEGELAAIQGQAEHGRKVSEQIDVLTKIEQRNAAVAALAASLDEGGHDREDRAVRPTPATTRDRDPGHYLKGRGQSFFGDMFKAHTLRDSAALRRLGEHNRALDMAGEGPGVIPPVWMAQEFVDIARQQRRASAVVRQIPITSAAPMSLPRQTATTAAVVLTQSAENAATSFADAWDSAVDTVSPKAISGGQEVSRQLLDSSMPAIDTMIWMDLIEEYNRRVEDEVVSRLITAAGGAVVTYANEAAYTLGLDPTAPTYIGDAITDTAIAVRNARKAGADYLVSSVTRYGSFLKIKDTTGRPVMPADSGRPMNVIGTGQVQTDGNILGLDVLASDSITQYPESILVFRSSDTILFESPTLRFRYDEPKGPETIRLGVWGYVVAHVKRTESVRRIVITAAV